MLILHQWGSTDVSGNPRNQLTTKLGSSDPRKCPDLSLKLCPSLTHRPQISSVFCPPLANISSTTDHVGHQITAFLCLIDLGLLHRPLEKGVDMGSLLKSASRWDPQGLIIRPYTVSCDLCGASGSCPVDFRGPCRLRSFPTCVEERRTREKTGANLTKMVTKTKWLGEKKKGKKTHTKVE